MDTAKPYLVAPVASCLGARLTRTSMEDNILSPRVQVSSILALVERFPGIDLVFPFMDTSVEARALGCPHEFKGRVPVVSAHPFADPGQIAGIETPDPYESEPMHNMIEVTGEIARVCERPVMSFVVGPVTLAAHLMGVTALVRLAAGNPAAFSEVLENCVRIVEPYGRALASSGASGVVILEPQLVFFPPRTYEQAVRPAIERLARALPRPALHVCGDTRRHLAAFGLTRHVECLSLDEAVDFAQAKDSIPELEGKTLMGNIPAVNVMHRGTPEDVRSAVERLVGSMQGTFFILSTGCDMVPDTPLENMEAFMQAAARPLAAS